MQKAHNNWLGMLKRIVIVVLFIGIVAAGVWILSGPKKELSTSIQWSKDEATGQIVPLFCVYYKWDGVENWSPTWIVFPKQDKWWIVDIRIFIVPGTQKYTLQSFGQNWRKYSHPFDEKWTSNRYFMPAPTRYQAVMIGLGFNVLFTLEEDAFSDVLKGTQAFDEGWLRPEE